MSNIWVKLYIITYNPGYKKDIKMKIINAAGGHYNKMRRYLV